MLNIHMFGGTIFRIVECGSNVLRVLEWQKHASWKKTHLMHTRTLKATLKLTNKTVLALVRLKPSTSILIVQTLNLVSVEWFLNSI